MLVKKNAVKAGLLLELGQLRPILLSQVATLMVTPGANPHDVWWVLMPMIAYKIPGPTLAHHGPISSSCIRICLSIPGLSPRELEAGKNLPESHVCVCVLLWKKLWKIMWRIKWSILRQSLEIHQCSRKQIKTNQLSSRDPSARSLLRRRPFNKRTLISPTTSGGGPKEGPYQGPSPAYGTVPECVVFEALLWNHQVTRFSREFVQNT